jgi:hypothetical protein
MNTCLNAPLLSILKLRLLIGFLGERAQFGWWPTAFYEASGRLFLEPIFVKTSRVAQYHGVIEAARRHHDEALNAGAYHLFRLPEEIEQDLHMLMLENGGDLTEGVSYDDTHNALDALAGLAGAAKRSALGPIAIGNVSDVADLLNDIAAVYASAFAADAQAIPYLVR